MYRIGIVGASSLAGKELTEELAESLLATSDFVLLDEDETAGQVTAAGDEPVVVQRIDATSFERLDFVFFAGTAEVTKRYWKQARKAGAAVVDLSYGLEGEAGVMVRSPLVSRAVDAKRQTLLPKPDLKTQAVIAAHPAAVMLALVAARLDGKLGAKSLAATVMEPASEYGREAMDELHQQTVNLLSFHALPREQYDAQVSFNLLPTLGEVAKVKLGATALRIREHYRVLSGAMLPELELQLVQAPVFHGYTSSVRVELGKEATPAEVETALAGDNVDVVGEGGEPPSNLSAAGQEDVMAKVTAEPAGAEESSRYWIWLAADNLKLAAVNAIACALELRKLRPSGKVQ